MNLDQTHAARSASANFTRRNKDAADLDGLAARTKQALVPVTPAPEFRTRLRDGLRMAAYHREMRDLMVRQRAETPWGLLVGAAALGSAAGLLAIVLRARQGAHPGEQVMTAKTSKVS